MPAITYITEQEAARWRGYPHDRELSRLLTELCDRTGDDWIVMKNSYTRRGFFRDQYYSGFALLVYVGIGIEYQIIGLSSNDAKDIHEQRIRSRDAIINYIIGFLSGLDERKRISNEVG